jgi:hypothetical protein
MRGGVRPLTAAQQALHLKHSLDFPGSVTLRPGRLLWRGDIRPNPISRCYGVRLEFAAREAPGIFVETPDLHALAGGRKLPHLYEQRPPRLCLYLPMTGQWRPEYRLDQTILPWAALWFFYFEDWLESDDWKGGGEHPR